MSSYTMDHKYGLCKRQGEQPGRKDRTRLEDALFLKAFVLDRFQEEKLSTTRFIKGASSRVFRRFLA